MAVSARRWQQGKDRLRRLLNKNRRQRLRHIKNGPLNDLILGEALLRLSQ